MTKGSLVCFSGAGLSADSGIATFRGSNGLWNDTDINQVCNHLTWKRHFEEVHRFYNARRADMAKARPNAMHRTLADLQKRHGATLITQNIDGLLEAAGAEEVLHVHGRIDEMLCEACGRTWSIGTDAWDPEHDRCSCNCRKGVKPNVVFFHERAPAYRDMWRVFKSLTEAGVLLVIGTDGAVVPIGEIARTTAARRLLCTLALPEDPQPGMVRAEDFDTVLLGRAEDQAAELSARLEAILACPAR